LILELLIYSTKDGILIVYKASPQSPCGESTCSRLFTTAITNPLIEIYLDLKFPFSMPLSGFPAVEREVISRFGIIEAIYQFKYPYRYIKRIDLPAWAIILLGRENFRKKSWRERGEFRDGKVTGR